MFKRTDFLIITPATSGGSWTFLDGLISRLDPSLTVSLCSGQKLQKVHRIMQLFSLPMPNYERYGILINSNAFFVIAYSSLLLMVANLVMLIERPRLIIANGLSLGVGVLPLSRFTKSKIMISYHGYFGKSANGILRMLISTLQKNFAVVVVNSETSRKDLESTISTKKLMIVEHWADKGFFSIRNRGELRSRLGLGGKFVVLFVGRIDREKQAPLLIEAAKRLSHAKDFVFLFAGTGEFARYVINANKAFPNIRYLGYIDDKKKLAELYSIADLVWGYADETYLARPAVESLACGTPILIPDTPAVLRRIEEGAKVPKELVQGIGWTVNQYSPAGLAERILSLKEDCIINDQLRDQCREHATAKYSEKNLEEITHLIHQLAMQKNKTPRVDN